MPKTAAVKKTTAKKSAPIIADLPTTTAPETMYAEPDASASQAGLKELFVNSIKDIYWAENFLVKNLPKMMSAATSSALQTAIENHLLQTKEHVTRLENVLEMLGEKKQAKKCDAMEGLGKEGEGIIEETDAGTPARDTGIIMASRKVEHYEIATYDGLVQLAAKLGFTDVSEILNQTLTEEKEADQLLAGIAAEDSPM